MILKTVTFIIMKTFTDCFSDTKVCFISDNWIKSFVSAEEDLLITILDSLKCYSYIFVELRFFLQSLEETIIHVVLITLNTYPDFPEVKEIYLQVDDVFQIYY